MTGSNPQEFLGRSMSEWLNRLEQGARALADVGDPEIGTAPKTAIYREDKVVLYRYEPHENVPARLRTPLVSCYALVNRPYMMDLQPDRSLIRRLLERGIDVYLIDWGYPDGADRLRGLEDYALRYLGNCIDAAAAHAGVSKVNLLGVCQGGTFSLCHAALRPERIRNLITMVTPVDFRTPDNLLTKWSDGIDIDALVDTMGNVPGSMLNAVFLALMPYRLMSQKYVAIFDQPTDRAALENFVRMEKWIFDSPDHPGELYREFINRLVKENRLVNGTLEIAGERVDLGNVRMPVLNIYAQRDHLVPPDASRALARVVGTRDYTEHSFNGGHIGIYVSAAAQTQIPTCIAKWLSARDEEGRARRRGA
jgi:polyhydroxyalkanoate synthase